MIKKKIFLHSGFTIAELLLSLLVVMVVATALVPIVGPKKVKVPTFNRNSGVFECYYDDSGALMQYHADKKSNRNNVPVAAGFNDHCEFDVPMANHYELYAIGAGSDSSNLDESNIGYRMTPAGSLSGDIDVERWQDSFNDANRFTNQATGITENSMEDALRNALDDWARRRRSSGSDLYVKFSNLQAPIEEGGSGYSKAAFAAPQSGGGSLNCGACSWDTTAPQCIPDTSIMRSTDNQFGERYILFDDYDYNTTTVQRTAASHNRCAWLKHAGGGDSAYGRAMIPGYSLMVPVDGFKGGGLEVTRNYERLRIMTTTRNGSAQIDLKNREMGNESLIHKDATYDSSTNSLKHGEDAPSNAIIDTFSNSDGLFKYLDGGRLRVMLDKNFKLRDDDPNGLFVEVKNFGSKHGKENGEGTRLGGGRLEAHADYTQNAFSWSYSKLQAIYNYANSGQTGEVKVLTFNNLRGKLYMYPANPTLGLTRSIVANAATPNVLTARLLSAKSGANGTGWQPYAQLGPVDLDPDTMPFPPDEIVKAATPDNDKFGRYIDRIRALGLKNGLYDCKDQGKCPGYAGGGAYPFLDSISGANTLKITDNQGLNGTPYVKDYAFPLSGAGSCPDGTIQKTKGQKQSYTDSNGNRHEYDVKYCESTSKASNGAVILIW